MDFNFYGIISDKFDWTIVDKAIHDEVVRLTWRIIALENKSMKPPAVDPDPDMKSFYLGLAQHMRDLSSAVETSDGMNTKVSAVEMAQSLELDDAIRTVAKSGHNHDRGPNWYAVWEDMNISATFGAGTNSASVNVVIPNATLYHANDFGQHIETFRYGPWVQRLMDHANVLRQANDAQRNLDEAAKAIDEAAKFEEVDF